MSSAPFLPFIAVQNHLTLSGSDDSTQVRVDGTIYGEGEGASITADGEMLAWKGSALGKLKQGGAVSYRGIVYYRTTSEKLARLNTIAGVFEYEADGKGDTHLKVYEWK